MNDLSTMELRHRLKLARDYAGYKTAKDFAAAAGVSNTSYAQYESGRSKTIRSDATIQRIAEAAGVNAQWLKTGKGEPIEGDPDALDEIRELTEQHEHIHSQHREHDKKLLKLILKALKSESENLNLSDDDLIDIAFLAFDQIKDTNLKKSAQYRIVPSSIGLALQVHQRK